ncbi:MAG TPA: EamA family transporter [Pasteurellaceae bacterium]|nr:EamA family transporter [Pasteurellaceae bacterium]
MQRSRHSKAVFFAVLTILMWSSLATLMVSINHLPPLFTVGVILIIASILFMHRWREWRLPLSVWIKGGIGLFGYHYLLFDAFTRAPAMAVNMIQYLWPLFIVLGTPLFLPSKLNRGHILGGILAFFGVVITLSQQKSEALNTDWFGYIEAFCAALLWAYYTLSNAKIPNMPSSAIAGFCFVSGGLAIAVFFLFGGGLSSVELSWQDGLIILLLGLGPMGLSFYSWDYAIRHGDPRFIGVLSYLTPLLSMTIMALWFPNMALTWLHLIALCMIISGVFLGRLYST